jgi:hypothetical protein
MRNKIFGVIGVLWGAAIIVYGVTGGSGNGTGSYEAGSSTALVFGALLLVVGGWTLAKNLRA